MIAPAHSGPRHLDRRPEARAFSVEDLLHLIQDGKLRIPDFQRPLNWENEDRLLFFDSLFRGYPVGTLLLWKQPVEAGRIRLGTLEIDTPKMSDALWVVDGQQRLTTLADVLVAEPGEGKQLFADLEAASLVWGKPADRRAPRFLPLREISDLERLLEWAHSHRAPDEFRRRAFDLAKRIREYQVPAYLVEVDDDAVLREIFRRTNTQGKELKLSEVFDALHRKRFAQSPSSLREIGEVLQPEGFGRLDGELILRSLLFVRKLDPAGNIDQIKPAEVPEALVQTAAAIRRAIVFARGQAGFPHLRLLPYSLALAALALFFDLHPEPSSRSRRLLARWLWRGAINGTHRGDRGLLRRTIASIDGDEEASLQRLLKLTGHQPSEPLELGPFNFRYARSKLQVLALAELHPLDLRTLVPIDVATLCEQQGIPVAELSSESGVSSPARGLAGRLVHPHMTPSALRDALRAASIEALASHAISPTAREALLADDLERFFDLREGDLGPLVTAFLDRRAEWGDSDRPSIGALLSDGEGEEE